MSVTDEDRNHPLVSVLRARNRRLAHQATNLIEQSPRLLEYTLSTFPSGTDHTERHTQTVEKIGRMVLSDDFLSMMTDEELFLLAVACHYHDLAMAGTEADDQSAETREQVRRDHAVRIGSLISDKWAELGFETSRLAEILGEVCRGHRPAKDAEGIAHWNDLNPAEILAPGIVVRVRLISALIYAIDELHLGSDRAPERVRDWREITNEESRRHWRRHNAVSGPVLLAGNTLLFQVSADTPEFEENLRSQVFRKAFSAMSDLKSQAAIEGITSSLPSITIQWQRNKTWDLLLLAVCAEMSPTLHDTIVEQILNRFRSETLSRIELVGVCTELGNSDEDLRASISRAVCDAVRQGHLIALNDDGLVLSTMEAHADIFFKRTQLADNLDLLFVGRYRHNWTQDLFASHFGREYIRNSVFPIVDRTYSVKMGQRPMSDPIRVLLESCPSAARLVRDYAPQTSNLVKEPLLAQAALTGALIDIHTDPEHLLNEVLRTAVRALATKNELIGPTVNLLEELALIGGFTTEQVLDATRTSEAARNEVFPDSADSISLQLTQTMPCGAGESSHFSRLLLASRRAGTPIRLRAADDLDLSVTVEGQAELDSPLLGFEVMFAPAENTPTIATMLAARVEVNRITRTIRLVLSQLNSIEPTPYPIVISLPRFAPSKVPSGTIRTWIHWPEATVRDIRAIVSANKLAREGRARLELVLGKDEQLIGSSECPPGASCFVLGRDDDHFQRALRGLPNNSPCPTSLTASELIRVGNMAGSARQEYWDEISRNCTDRHSAVFIRMLTAEGRPFEEQFLRFLPYDFIKSPEIDESSAVMTANELKVKWNDGRTDFAITGFFAPDMFELATNLRDWCRDLQGDFPFGFSNETSSEPTLRTMLTIRLLPRRNRVWHQDRPVIFEFRPVNRRESYHIEAEYWRGKGDEPRAKLAEEIRDREPLEVIPDVKPAS